MLRALLTRFCLVLLVWIAAAGLTARPAQAQSVATGSAQVTASVEDNAPPTTPILISPSNNSYVTTTIPYFVWEASSDDNGMDHYRLSIDGATLFDSIPTSDTDNSEYTLTYNSSNQRYTLIPKSGFTQSSHTWRIGAYDALQNLSESATWTFTIDTQAPTFVMTQLGSESVSISAQDSGTIPSSPVELSANEPLLAGNGDASATVLLTVTIPGDPTQQYNFSITGGGNWSQQLGLLPRDVVITLDFVITDQAGNISVLSGVQFIIPTEVIVFPPSSPSPTPSPIPTPTPDVTPAPTTSPSSEPTPTPEPTFQVSIPIVPPREVVNEVVQEFTERFIVGNQLVQALPEGVKQVVSETLSTIAPISAVIATTAVPVTATFALASQFGSSLSIDILVKVMQSLGLLPAGKPQGIVFESTTYEPVSFARLNIFNEGQTNDITETVVTDVNGVYKGIKLPPGKYRIGVDHQDFRFPSEKSRPNYLKPTDFYHGEVFSVTGLGEEQLMLIPVDKITQTTKIDLKHQLQIMATQLSRRTNSLVLPVFGVSAILAALFPTVWNLTMCGVYSILAGRKALIWFRTPLVTGTVVDEQGMPIERAIIRLNILGANELTSLLATDEHGRFVMYARAGKYMLSVTKPGYIWYDQSAPLSSYEVDASKQAQSLVVTMKPIGNLYQELGLA